MRLEGPRDVAESIRQRLLNIARRQGEDFGLILTRYAMERLLYRLSESKYRGDFILKGAMLFQIWANIPHRPTRDLDLLGRGDPSPEHCLAVLRELCGITVSADGLDFPVEAIRAEKIKEDQEYEGVRVRLLARMGKVRIPIQVDIGFGDALVSNPGVLDYPTLLAMPAPRIQVYPMETVISEKLEAMVHLGMVNSRMKDFFDVWLLARTFSFAASALANAIHATFERRGTPLDRQGFEALIAELATDASKLIQWRAFLNKGKLAAADNFAEVVGSILVFALVPLQAAEDGARGPTTWSPGGPWHEAD